MQNYSGNYSEGNQGRKDRNWRKYGFQGRMYRYIFGQISSSNGYFLDNVPNP